jgi:hypothetical protein
VFFRFGTRKTVLLKKRKRTFVFLKNGRKTVFPEKLPKKQFSLQENRILGHLENRVSLKWGYLGYLYVGV